MIKNKINFKQPKYIIPTIAYFGLLLVSYLFIDLFDVEIKDVEDNGLQTTEYLNAELPSANVKDDIGNKLDNVRRSFGNISDRSAVSTIDLDYDSLRKKEEFDSRYSEEELRLLEEKARQDEEIKRLKALNERLSESARRGESMGSDEFDLPMTDDEREKALAMRRSGMLKELERDLGRARADGASQMGAAAEAFDTLKNVDYVIDHDKAEDRAVHSLDDDAESNLVVKKADDTTGHFNTLSENTDNSNLIKAIIDEEIKAVDGSRVRLRLLDDIEIGGVTLSKGSYLFATMSGFSQQRVKGTVSSVLIGDEILKINLSIYDTTDGLEGLYVPASAFRETAKDVGSAAMQGSMNMNSGYNDNSLSQWAGQALQNAYQRTSNAISKAIKKNRVRLKYGTHVYLINGKENKRGRNGDRR